MAKILLVEDDNNLREIYEARLQAEGYEIVSAKDGEEALVIAKKERPDLIIADVMMPRVSGFEMLDILRNTPELKDVHVIMLTALGQAEDKTRADSLGADRYLVKSQVTLEDIVKAAADVLAGAPAVSAAATAAAGGAAQAAVPLSPAPAAITPTIPVASPPAVPDVAAPAVQPAAQPPSAPAAVPAAPIALHAPAQDTAAASAIPQPSAADSQLVTAAVNNLAAGSAIPPDTGIPATPQPTAPAPAAPTPAIAASSPQPLPNLTMEPVLSPPVTPPPKPPAPTEAATTEAIPPSGRKAIQPLASGTTPGQPDLNELMAREGHTMDDTPQIFNGTPHMPGNVIAPGAPGSINPAPTPPSTGPIDPNSISL